ELISYVRPDRPDARISSYRVIPIADPQELAEALNDVLGVRTVVEKRRRLLIHHDTRIHLDDVEGLGTFVELESPSATSGAFRSSATRSPSPRTGWCRAGTRTCSSGAAGHEPRRAASQCQT